VAALKCRDAMSLSTISASFEQVNTKIAVSEWWNQEWCHGDWLLQLIPFWLCQCNDSSCRHSAKVFGSYSYHTTPIRSHCNRISLIYMQSGPISWFI